MSSTRKKFPVRRHPVVVDIGCGCHRPKLSSLFSSSSIQMPKTRNPSSPTATTSASMSQTATSTTTTTSYISSPSQSNSEIETSARKTRTKSIVDESEPVVKESSDPYHDFRDSMLHMIMEKEISSWDDLRALLHRFLALNSARHHHLILRAWNSLFEQFSTSIVNAASTGPPRDRRWRRSLELGIMSPTGSLRQPLTDDCRISSALLAPRGRRW